MWGNMTIMKRYMEDITTQMELLEKYNIKHEKYTGRY